MAERKFDRGLVSLFRKSTALRFIVIGSVNTVFSYLIFSLAIYCGLDYVLACLISSCLGIIFSFNTLGKVVFNQPDTALFWRFVGVYVMLYFFSLLTIKIGTYFLENLYLLGAISTVINAALAYFVNKHFVFQRLSHEIH